MTLRTQQMCQKESGFPRPGDYSPGIQGAWPQRPSSARRELQDASSSTGRVPRLETMWVFMASMLMGRARLADDQMIFLDDVLHVHAETRLLDEMLLCKQYDHALRSFQQHTFSISKFP